MTMTLADRTDLESLPSISLAELVTHAELLVRMDRKYLLDDEAVSAFIRGLPVGTRVLEIDGQRSVGYRSLYHDTSGLDAYRGTAQRRRRRFKVRTREYGTGGTFLEVKTRRGLFTIKERIECESVAGQLDASAMTYVTERLADAGIPLDQNVQPTLWTAYRRTTLLLPDEARVTIDTDLVWSDMGADSLQCDGLTIVETKSGTLGFCSRSRAVGGRASPGLPLEVRHRARRPEPRSAEQPVASAPHPAHGDRQSLTPVHLRKR